jgi:hypothetical protein
MLPGVQQATTYRTVCYVAANNPTGGVVVSCWMDYVIRYNAEEETRRWLNGQPLSCNASGPSARRLRPFSINNKLTKGRLGLVGILYKARQFKALVE